MNFVVFSDDWGRHPSSCQHLFGRIVRRYPVTWVNTIGMRTPRWHLADLRRAGEKLAAWSGAGAALGPVPEGLEVLHPVMVPYDSLRPIRSFNTHQVVRAIRRSLARRDLASPVVVTTVPNVCDCLGRLGEALSIYYCVDDFTRWPGLEQELLRDMEQRLLDRVDMVVATSALLARTRRARRGPTYCLPHGVDVAHFAAAGQTPPQRPPELQAVRPPILGMFGLVDERVDVGLVRAVAARRPDWSWAFVGPCRLSDSLAGLANVHRVGPVSYAHLPAVCAAFDVCVLPYRVDEQTASINPLKLREYLATGKPVVATPLPEALALGLCLDVAASPQDWIRAVERCLAEGVTPAQAASRARELQEADWSLRARQMLAWVRQGLARCSAEAVGS